MNIYLGTNNCGNLTIGRSCGGRAYVWCAPDDLDGVWLAIKRNALHFHVDAFLAPSGVWIADILPGHVPEACKTEYEVYGVRGEQKQLMGRGKLTVSNALSATGSATPGTTPSPSAALQQVYDADGVAHTLTVVTVDGETTLQVD